MGLFVCYPDAVVDDGSPLDAVPEESETDGEGGETWQGTP